MATALSPAATPSEPMRPESVGESQASRACSAAPTAWAKRVLSSQTSSASERPKTSRIARTTPALSDTPPTSATGASTGRPRTMSALKLFAMA